MKAVTVLYGLLVVAGLAASQSNDGPATGPSGTVCESAGGSCAGITDGLSIAYKGDCTKYIVCFLECGCDMSCGPGLHYNPTLRVCDWPNNAGCDSGSNGNSTDATPGPGSGGTNATPGTGGNGTDVTPSPGSNDTDVTSATPTSGPATGPSGTVCESPGGSCVGMADGTKIYYAGNCSKYIVCFLECGCDMECPGVLNFNIEKQICDWPEDAGCNSSYTTSTGVSTVTTPSSINTSSEGSSSSSVTTSIPDTTSGSGSSSSAGSTPGSGSSSSAGTTTTERTTTSSGSSSSAGTTPGSGSSSSAGTTLNSESTPGSGTTESSTPGATVACESLGGSCAGRPTGDSIPYEGNCSRYVVCVEGCGVDMNCPDNLHFNSKLYVCDYPANAGCDSSYTTSTGIVTVTTPSTGNTTISGSTGAPASTTPGTGNPSSIPSTTPSTGNSSSIATTTPITGNSSSIATTTPSTGDSTPSGSTETPVSTTPGVTPPCDSPGASCVGKDTGDLLPYSGKCSKYVACVGECGFDMECPGNLHFNSKLEVCDYPEDAGCDSSYTTSTGTPSTGNTTISGSTATTGSTTPITGNSSSIATTTPITGNSSSVATTTPIPGNSSSIATTTPIPGNSSSIPTTTPSTGDSTPSGSTGTPVSTTPGVTPPCDSPGASCIGKNTGDLLPYSGNCSKYVACVGECGFDMECPDNLHFNSQLEVCDYPDHAGCDQSYSTGTGIITQTTPISNNSSAAPSTLTTASNATTDSSGTTEPITLPTPGSGTTENGGSTTPGSTATPASTAAPASTTPSPATTVTSGGDTTPTPTTSSTSSGPATGPSGTVCESAGGSCKGLPDGEKIPFAGDCSKYIVCFQDCGCDMPCGPGLQFNKVLQVCDWPANAGCEA